MKLSDPLRFAVVGADHLHVFSIVDGLVRAGAIPAAHTPSGVFASHYADWQTDSVVASAEEVLADQTIQVIVTVGVPSERAEVALDALEAGKAVVSAKPGVTSRAQLDALRAALTDRAGRPWTVLFTERFENRAVLRGIELAQQGAIGTVVRVHGVGPHTLDAPSRPEWFFDPARSGGILVDLASHQIDEFLCLSGDPEEVEVLDAAAGNVANPQYPHFQDVGSVHLVGGGIEGHHSVDLLSPAGLETWGDVRLEIVGTTGTLEVRANVDVGGEAGTEHLILVDGEGARRVDVSDVRLDWAATLLADVQDRTDVLMSQAHVLAVSELSLGAATRARPWGACR